MKPPQPLHALGIQSFSGPAYSYPAGSIRSGLTVRDLRFLAQLVRCDPSQLGVGTSRSAQWPLYCDDWLIVCPECVRNDTDADIAPFELEIWRRAACTVCPRHQIPLIQVRDFPQDCVAIDRPLQPLNRLEKMVLPELLAFERDITRAFRGIAPRVLDEVLSASEYRQVIADLATFASEAWSTGGFGTVNSLSQHSRMLSHCPTLFHSRRGTRRYLQNGVHHVTLAHMADPATRRAALWLVLQVLESPPMSRPTHPLQLGQSAHDDFFGSIRREGHGWLVAQAQAWPDAYRTHYWPEFSATFKGTSATFKGPQCH